MYIISAYWFMYAILILRPTWTKIDSSERETDRQTEKEREREREIDRQTE